MHKNTELKTAVIYHNYQMNERNLTSEGRNSLDPNFPNLGFKIEELVGRPPWEVKILDLLLFDEEDETKPSSVKGGV